MQIATSAHLGEYDRKGVIESARYAESLGFEAMWVPDHIIVPTTVDSTYPYSPSGRIGEAAAEMLDPFVLMATITAVTERLRVGISVMIVGYRNPVLVAKALATIDHLSEGRLDVGIGAGWMAEEFQALDMPFAERGRRTDEFIALYKKLWIEDPVSFDGKYYQLKESRFLPKPHQKPYPPIWVGGHSDAALRRLVTLGDVWQPVNMPASDMPTYIEKIRQICAKQGRDFSTLRLAVNRGVLIVDDPSKIRPVWDGFAFQPLVATPDGVIEEFRRYRELGVTQVQCYFTGRTTDQRYKLARRFAEEILPAVNA